MLSQATSTQERLLDATLAALAQRGGHRLSMTAVAQAAGVSRMTLYRYYPTKDALLEALARHEQRRFDDQLADALDRAESPSAQIDAVLRVIVAFQDGFASGAIVEAGPAFVLERLRRALPVQRATLERLVGDALAETPVVRAGAATPGELAELILRVSMSHLVLPYRDADALLGALRSTVGLERVHR